VASVIATYNCNRSTINIEPPSHALGVQPLTGVDLPTRKEIARSMEELFCTSLKSVLERKSSCISKTYEEERMKPLEQLLAEADQQKAAAGHFNISDLVALKAIYSAARELNVPVLVGVSEGECDFIGVHEIAA